MEMALVKIRYKLFWHRVAKFSFIVIMMNGTFFCKLSTAIILSFWLERASISSHCWVVFNSFLSFTAIPLNIVTMYPMQKATSLPNNLTTLLLTLAISDVVVGLFAQSFYTFWSSGYNWITLLSCNVYQMLNISGIYF